MSNLNTIPVRSLLQLQPMLEQTIATLSQARAWPYTSEKDLRYLLKSIRMLTQLLQDEQTKLEVHLETNSKT